jgi:hypothetical protein
VTPRVTGNPEIDPIVIVYSAEVFCIVVIDVGLASIVNKSVAPTNACCVSTRIAKTKVEARSLDLNEPRGLVRIRGLNTCC